MLKIILKWWLGRHWFRFKFKGTIGCSADDASIVSFDTSMLMKCFLGSIPVLEFKML